MNTQVDLSILACYAHPDDEQGVTGTLRAVIEQGGRAGILCATRGEVGEISDPALATRETLGQVREQELRRAAAMLGISDVFFLNYRDSGMDGAPENQDTRAFINAPEYEAVGRIVRVIRAFRPTLVVTFDESGGYGHPDHIAIQRCTTLAFHAAADPKQYLEAGPAFAPRRLFYSSIVRSDIRRLADYLRTNGIDSLFASLDVEKFGLDDARITNVVDVGHYVGLKRDSLAHHKTQINPNSIFARLPEELWNQWRSVERFALVAGDPFPPGAELGDLFAGLR